MLRKIEQPHTVNGDNWFFQTFISHSGATGGQHMTKDQVELKLTSTAGPGELVIENGNWFWDDGKPE